MNELTIYHIQRLQLFCLFARGHQKHHPCVKFVVVEMMCEIEERRNEMSKLN